MKTALKLFTLIIFLFSVSLSAQVIGSKVAKKYHTKECTAAKKISQDNLVEFKSIEEAKAAGYTACKICSPGVQKELKAVKEKKAKEVKEAKTEAAETKKAALKETKEKAAKVKTDAIKEAKDAKKKAADAKTEAAKKAKDTKKELKDTKKEVLDDLKK